MKLICLGDSITYGYGVREEEAWPALVAEKTGWEVVNEGVCGDTTAVLLARLRSRILPGERERGEGTAVILLGGTNDALCSVPLQEAKKNMETMLFLLHRWGAAVYVGLPLPVIPMGVMDFGEEYMDFSRVNGWLAELSRWLREQGVPVLNFPAAFRNEGGSIDPRLFSDGVHPGAEGHRRMAKTVMDTVRL